jgi:hypothetical protein
MSRFGEEYKFPDEVGAKADDDQKMEITVEGDDDVEVNIVDDTPKEDRHIDPLPESIKEDLERADESAEYSKNVKQKFTQYKKAWHDERRAKEAALREQQEALTAAQQILDENRRLRTMVQSGEKELISTYQSSAEMELETASRNYREAYDSGDSEKLLNAQRALTQAEMKLDKTKNYRPTVQPAENSVQTTPQPQSAPQMDPKVANWVSKNPWFVSRDKVAMRKYAEGVHEELETRYGRAFVGTDEYFTSIDKEVQRRFPEEFAPSKNDGGDKPQRTRPSTVVAPARRSTAPKQIQLTKTQAGIAKKLGVTLEQYAREISKLEA